MKKFVSVLLAVLAVFLMGACSQPTGTEVISVASAAKAPMEGGKEIIMYFTDWSVYGGHDNYRVANVPFDKITIINFSFLSIVDDVHTLFNGFKNYTKTTFGRDVQKYEAAWLDEYADVQNPFGVVDWESPYCGVLGQFKYYREMYPHLKLVPSIGGWTKGHMFSEMANDPAARAIFVNSCVTLAREYNFDGVDIDWEYPGIDRAPDPLDEYDWGCPGNPAYDSDNFTTLMRELREAFDAAEIEDGKEYIVTAAVGIGYDKVAQTNPTEYHQYLDYINLMTYDMHGAWESFTGHQAPMYANPNAPYDPDIRDKYTIEYAVEQFAALGVPKSKMTLGLPFYTRGWGGVPAGDNPALPGLYETSSSKLVGKWDNPQTPGGQGPYFDVKSKIDSGALNVYYDDVSHATYAYGNGQFYTFDTKAMIEEKCDYIISQGLGGAMVWEVDGDTWKDGSYELTNAIVQKLYGKSDVVPSPTPTATIDPNAPTFTPTPTPPPEPFWDAETVYNGGERVFHKGCIYSAKYWNQGDEPGDEWDAWQYISGTPDSTPTPVVTPVITNTPTATATNTPVVTPTNTPIVTPTNTPIVTVTNTPVVTPTNTPTVTPPTPTPTEPAGYPAWAPNTSYAQGDKVSYNGANYECRQPHTSLLGWEPPNVPALWSAL